MDQSKTMCTLHPKTTDFDHLLSTNESNCSNEESEQKLSLAAFPVTTNSVTSSWLRRQMIHELHDIL